MGDDDATQVHACGSGRIAVAQNRVGPGSGASSGLYSATARS